MKDLYKTLILAFLVISAITLVIFLAVRTESLEPFVTDCLLPLNTSIEKVPNFKELINDENISIDTLQQETNKELNGLPIDYEKEEYLKHKAEVIKENDLYLENSLERKPNISEKTLEKDHFATNLENSYKKLATRRTKREEFIQQEFINVYDANFGGVLPTTLGLY
jgi:hypothetical protein